MTVNTADSRNIEIVVYRFDLVDNMIKYIESLGGIVYEAVNNSFYSRCSLKANVPDSTHITRFRKDFTDCWYDSIQPVDYKLETLTITIDADVLDGVVSLLQNTVIIFDTYEGLDSYLLYCYGSYEFTRNIIPTATRCIL